MLTTINLFQEAYDNAIEAIIKLREKSEELKDAMEDVINACEEIEGAL